MEKLSIEEKAKAYDEAIKRAKDFMNGEAHYELKIGENIMCWVFPELRESGDERIRKGLLYVIEHYHTLPTEEAEEYIAWLERQGEKKTAIEAWKEMRLEVYAQASGNRHEVNCSDDKTKMFSLSDIDEIIEKISEQKPNPYSGTSFEYNGHTWGMCARDNGVDILFNKKLIQHINAEIQRDKIKPMFKVKYNGNEYNVLDIRSSAGIIFYGIEDEPNHIDYVQAQNCEEVDGYGIKENGSPYPTKSVVFSEQTPADKVEPKFKVGDWVVWDNKVVCNITGYINKDKKTLMYVITDTNGMERTYSINGFDNNARLWDITKDAKEGDVLVASDNSIFIFAGVVDGDCKYYAALTSDHTVQINKDIEGGYWETAIAVHPATKEQCDTLKRAISNAGYEWNAEKKELKKVEQEYHCNGVREPKEATGVLKQLLDKENYVWSEEDKVKINRIVAFLENLNLEYLNVAGNDILLKDIEWLKSLKDRYTWKPSEEQMDALETAVSSLQSTALESLYQDLKKL